MAIRFSLGRTTLRLDPATLNQACSGALDPQGRAAVTYLVPANPSLVGVPVYWQALVAGPPRFTNLETTVATNL
ncbi:MAG: hypothetical protein L0323_13330 [Planctomycetes bacterium]|nr:hypothetical protein [Planctomycetota bacterium]